MNLANGDKIELIKFGSDFYYIDGSGKWTLFPIATPKEYKSLVMTIKDTGTPEYNIIQNDLMPDEKILFLELAFAGGYRIAVDFPNNNTDVLVSGKTVIFFNDSTNNAGTHFRMYKAEHPTEIDFVVEDSSGTNVGNLLNLTSVEIRVYN